MADVVERAGVSRRTFYEMFSDRDDCLLAAFDHAGDVASARLSAAYASDASWRERIRDAVIALLELFEDEPVLARFLVVESLAAGPRVLARRADLLAPVIAAVDEGRLVAPRCAVTPLTAEATVGAALALLHSRIADGEPTTGTDLLNPIVSLIVLPYLGPAAARREMQRSVSARQRRQPPHSNVYKALDIRLTYRTMRVLLAIGAHPGASNRQVSDGAEIGDQGQMSKLLTRLQRRGLIENRISDGLVRGLPNAWALTSRGAQLYEALAGHCDGQG